MGKNRIRPKAKRIGVYPTDELGFPIHPHEVSPRFIEPSERVRNVNNHHMAFSARQFGRTAIGQTFRDLASFQLVMPRWRHDWLHTEYTQMDLPPFRNMLERIEQESATPDALKIWDDSISAYRIESITDFTLAALKREYVSDKLWIPVSA